MAGGRASGLWKAPSPAHGGDAVEGLEPRGQGRKRPRPPQGTWGSGGAADAWEQVERLPEEERQRLWVG